MNGRKIIIIFSFFLILTATFFWRTWFKGEIPMPGDHIVGVYHPWIDYKWPGFPAGVPVKNPELADVPSLFYPQKIYSMSLLKSGEFPLWNPMIFNGYPLLANIQSGVLNPFNIYFLIFPSNIAWTLFIATQPFLAMIFAYFFQRVIRLRPPVAVFGSVIYAFCGFNLIWLEYGIHGYVTALIPLLFTLIYLAVHRHSRYWIYFSIVMALQIFCGYPQISLYTAIFGGLWLLYVLANRKYFLVNILRYAGVFILGLSLAAVLIVPATELFIQSQRIKEPLSGGQSGAYYQWSQIITLLAPDFFGNPTTYNTWGNKAYTNNTGYASVVGFSLGLLGLFSGHKYKRYFAWLFIIPLVLSLPSPVSRFIQQLPLFSASVATRIMVFSGLAVSILAAMGLQEILTNSKVKFIPLIIPGICLATAGIIALLGLYFSFPGSWLVGIRNLVFPTVIYLVAVAVTVLISRKVSCRPVLIWLLIIISAAELFRFGWKYNPFFPGHLIFPQTPEIEFLQRQTGYRIDGGDVLPLSIWMSYGLSSPTGYDAVYPAAWARYLGAIENGNINQPKGRIGDILSYKSQLFDLTATGYVLAKIRYQNQPYQQFLIPKFTPAYETESLRIYRNQNALPKYSLKTGREIFVNPDLEINRLGDPDFDYHKFITLSDPAVPELPHASDYRLTTVSDRPTRQKFEVVSNRPVFLLNTNSYYPGWRAKIDGSPTQLLKANFTFQSVLVPSGTHTVEFTYAPLSFTIGGAISLMSAIFLLYYVRSSVQKSRRIA